MLPVEIINNIFRLTSIFGSDAEKEDTPDTPEKKVETITETKTEKVDVPEVKSTVVKSTSKKDFNGGFFKSSFNEKNKNSDELETGNAGIFKSTSGW